ncbi:MAG: hypothetical protein CL811_01000 [Colwelliaceae bacterium]|nr:hypothetical protein [Colwelliaceae bacterium]
MNFLSKLKQNRHEAKLLESQKPYLEKFFVEADLIPTQAVFELLNSTKNYDRTETGIQQISTLLDLPSDKKGLVLVSPFSLNLITLIEKLYSDPSTCIYFINEGIEQIPFLQQICRLKRVFSISHKEALNLRQSNSKQSLMFICVPEFHPKSLMSEYRVVINEQLCKFSSFPWLLKHKQQLPIYYLADDQKLSTANQPTTTFESMASYIQSYPSHIFSWSRLHTHRVDELSKLFVSQANQLEALIRYIRPHLATLDLQQSLDALSKNKLALLSENLS